MNKKELEPILKQLTVHEKISLTSGRDFWNTVSIDRLNIPSISMSDGPHGLRKQVEGADHLGINESYPATCFPCAATLSCSWDESLLYQIGKAIANEAKDQHVDIVLGPGVNIKRSPLCGRNFEYFSEDPYLSGKLASSWVLGLEQQNIMSSLKHFALNNQETNRMISDSIIDERAMHEIYLKSFEMIVKQAKPSTIMSSYNKINGTYAGEHHDLLQHVLRDEWGFNGLIISDWTACNNKIASLDAGMGLIMPKNPAGFDKQVKKAIKNKSLSQEKLDERVLEVLTCAFNKNTHHEKANYNAHHHLAYQAATKSIVLLKNDQNILPINQEYPWLIIGEIAKKFRIQGSGSSLINPTQYFSFIDVCNQNHQGFIYDEGYSLSDSCNANISNETLSLANKSPFVLVFVGFSESDESEGFDKQDIKINQSQYDTIKTISSINKNVVVIINAGSPIEMPFIDDVKAILYTTLPGQAGAQALFDILTGVVNPSAKLTDTFVKSISDTPCYLEFGKNTNTALYKESIFVGYRYYSTYNIATNYPFGHGLSYSEFQYHDLLISGDFPDLVVSFTITNISHIPGEEIMQCYISPGSDEILQPSLELKGFKKILLQPKETKTIQILLSKDSFEKYNTNLKKWQILKQTYAIKIGASSQDIRLSKSIVVSKAAKVESCFKKENYPMFNTTNSLQSMNDYEFEKLIHRKIPKPLFDETDPFTMNSTLTHLSTTFVGNVLIKVIKKQQKKSITNDSSLESVEKMIEFGVMQSPLRSLATYSNGVLTIFMLKGILFFANLHRILSKTTHG